MRKRTPTYVLTIFLLLFWMAASAGAQEPGGSLQGSVRSQSGEAVAEALVVVRNAATGAGHSARTDAAGRFRIDGLQAGTYEVEVSGEGFVSQRRQGIEVSGTGASNLDFELSAALGAGDASGNRINEAQLVGLPLNGRSYSQLATLQAGVADTAGEQSSRGVGGGNLTVAGGRPTSNNFLLDGTNIMDTSNEAPRSAAGALLGADSVLQVQVVSSAYGAEFGRGSGGTVNSITLSGGNEFHGTLFEYFRNSKMDARNFFDGPEPPPFKRNQFGFTLTGPVRRERTFFMGSFEAMRDRLTETEVAFLPDAAARQGLITDRSGNTIRTVPVAPSVQPYLALYPLPNLGSIGGGIARNAAPVFLPANEFFFVGRVDHSISERDSLFARYTFDDASSTRRQSLFLFRTLTGTRQQYVTLAETHIFDLGTINTLRLGYTRPTNVIDTLSTIQIPLSLYFVPGAPVFGQIDIPGLAQFGPMSIPPEANTMNSFQVADGVVAQRGPHTLKFGAEVHRYRWDVFNSFQKGGVWGFNSLEDFLQAGPQGTALDVTLPGSDNSKGFRQTLAGFYLQDDIQVGPRLQVSLGLRYEFATIIKEKDNRLAILPDVVHDTEVQIGTMLPKNPSLKNLSPRVGFSWSPGDSGNTVLRGGFGIYYDPLLEYVIDLQKNSAPFYKRAINPNFDSSGVFPNALAGAALIPFGTPFNVDVLDYHHINLPSLLRYNFSVQQSLPGGWNAQATYVGARGNHLFRGYETNLYPQPEVREDGKLFFPPNSGPINPAFGPIAVTSSDAQSFYNALQVSVGQTAGRNIALQGSYSYSKSVDDASSSLTGFVATTARQYPHRRTLERGLSDFDLRHRLTMNYFYSLPVGPGQRWLRSGLLSKVLGGWRVGGIMSFRSGTPFHPLVTARAPGFLFSPNRPDLLPGRSNNPVSGVSSGCSEVMAGQQLGGPERYFDPCSFAVPEPGTLGTTGRNTMIGPDVFSMDLSIQKEFVLGGERLLQFRAEFFNLPNHANFASPPAGSRILGPAAGRLLPPTITTARQIQLALRLSF